MFTSFPSSNLLCNRYLDATDVSYATTESKAKLEDPHCTEKHSINFCCVDLANTY